jgi:regulator of sirC expression with transglutaminase-like and TPR domain
MAVAARVGLKVFGVNTPGHFVVGCYAAAGAVFIDPFVGGDALGLAACKRRIEETLGKKGVVSDEHFRPATPLEIAARVLRNLKAAYVVQNQWSAVLPVQERLSALLPHFPQERRDLALLYLRAGQPRRALPLLEEQLAVCGGEQTAVLRASIQAARKMIAELN